MKRTLDPAKTLALVRSAGCAALAGGIVASVICGLLAVITWVAAMGERPGLRVAGLDGYPPYLRPLYEDPRRITTLVLAIALAVAVTGFGLVRRREWGRKLTLAVATVGIVWVVAAVPVSWHTARLRAAQAPVDTAASQISPVFMVINSLVALAVLALLVFLVWALRSPTIRDQFRSRGL